MGSVCVPLASGASLVNATFLARPNQFIVEALLDDEQYVVRAHLADRGRLRELLIPGVPLVLAERKEARRKTAFQAVAVQADDELVSLDTHLARRLVATALGAGVLPQFARFPSVAAEVSIGDLRFDFRLSDGDGMLSSCMLEIKSATLLVDGLIAFPDAPSERARLHVEALTDMAQRGQRAALLFVVQRSQGRAVVPAEHIDLRFARAFRQAISVGVEVYAYRCPVSRQGIVLGHELPVFGSATAALAYG